MFHIKEYFGGREDDEPADKKKLNKWLIFAIIIAIVVLAGSGFWGGDQKTKTENKVEKTASVETDTEQYVAQMEKRLAEVLQKINGAGEVTVMISVDNNGEKILAADSKSKSDRDEKSESSKTTSTEMEKNIVMAGQGSSSQPIVVEEKKPVPTGVCVVAQGAKDETVRYEIYEAVKALYGLSAHRIKVTY